MLLLLVVLVAVEESIDDAVGHLALLVVLTCAVRPQHDVALGAVIEDIADALPADGGLVTGGHVYLLVVLPLAVAAVALPTAKVLCHGHGLITSQIDTAPKPLTSPR